MRAVGGLPSTSTLSFLDNADDLSGIDGPRGVSTETEDAVSCGMHCTHAVEVSRRRESGCMPIHVGEGAGARCRRVNPG